ncbi:MAG: transglutaminase family protein [Myxococcota bacterium]|nr:transglutaminase family protein [Myxococcota bacterium]
MAIRVALNHRTQYRYDRRVELSPQIVRLRPAPHCRTPVRSFSLRVEPQPHFLNWQQDPQSNWLARLVFPEPVDHFGLTVDLTAELSVINPFDFFLEESAQHFPFAYEAWLSKELAPFLQTLPPGPRLTDWLASVDRSEAPTVDWLVSLNQRLSHEIRYLIRMEPGVQSCEETLERGSGSCRDTAWLLVQVLRHLGLAARFVSGYLIQLRPDQKPLEGPAGAEEDFTDLHAWVEAYLPGAGWVGVDPTSGLFAGEGHLPLAASPDPGSASPVSGAVGECEVSFEFAMRVERIHEDPRVTRPYEDATWERIERLGEQVDAELLAGDVRLTMGGEPTFVSADDMEGDEWNYAALGPTKRVLAEALLRRMRARLTPGGLLHFGQGKWYPGEPLPRWALSCITRRDGVPVWRDAKLLAESERDYGFGAADAERFTRRLAERLEIDPDYAMPAFEDPLEHLRSEGRLPVNVDPLDSKLEDPKERERLRRVFERGLGTPVGTVLPLKRSHGAHGPAWQSGLWMLRGRHLVLIPGDSPLGLRLPLGSLPWQDPERAEFVEPLDPMAPRAPLPRAVAEPPRRHPPVQIPLGGSAPRERVHEQRLSAAEPDRAPAPGESASWVVRPALCVEARDGRLYVFLPPVETAEDFLDLVSAIESTAAELGAPVVVEGYAPPSDPRLERFSVTPDPGVLEVNVRPAASWRQLVDETTALYEDARQLRLGTEKFMLDGRHSGTGGGNHVVIGGPSAADSPLLRRPDLLRSLLGFWLDHPSLSYLFSGLFIGPTSQAPRIDEARHESVYELAIAFEQIPEPGAEECPPWLVDRIFRHLLTDVTGNTHRAEFCIDKLYAPETSTGRLGLLELRAFEMPPHARMSLTQQLLLRALVAWFWREPYRSELSRWGTQLHDRFLLPHFVDRDFRAVLGELSEAGYPFERAWFDAHFEFRFPKIGSVAPEGTEIELRGAIEPWHVLGEEPGGGGTVRHVDSSLERLQVRVRGLRPDRHVVACNGRALPLQPTGVEGESVAGVRFRAWQPPSCLHPTIPVQAPLVFDLVDRHAGRSLGGCTYRVAHPGGRSYETFPVNAYEAEARRAARFEPFGHTPGPMTVGEPERNPQFPYTLDLRRRPS